MNIKLRKKILYIGILGIFSGIFSHKEVSASRITREFTLTGYYSPLPTQKYFLTGSYESEIRLNGNGTHGADGTAVYPGMIAAPSNYSFGTKVCLPDFGCGVIHDRGGAIVNKGERNLARHDRLDLWMGYGEEGLARALQLGVDHVTGTIYPANSDIKTAVNFNAMTPLGHVIDMPTAKKFPKNLSIGRKGASVQNMVEALNDLGFDTNNTNYYNESVRKALLNFQKQYFVIYHNTDIGAGNFGPKTRQKLEKVWYEKKVQEKISEKWEQISFNKQISKGNRSAETLKLQEILVREEFMDHIPTGYFGSVTKEALIQFQIAHGIISGKNSRGAGQVGPKTQEKLNQYIAQEKIQNTTEENKKTAFIQHQKVLNYYARNFNTTLLTYK